MAVAVGAVAVAVAVAEPWAVAVAVAVGAVAEAVAVVEAVGRGPSPIYALVWGQYEVLKVSNCRRIHTWDKSIITHLCASMGSV